jgi:beta-1,4-mannosyl-glycoprotein beta-1,4-N-acetylglucosaminyltransferase
MIYDCFTFFNELDLLEIRLHVLAEVVDRFVLVEARQTFQRGEKPLYYAENRGRFSSFADRIEHVAVDEFPEEATGAFACESWQRNAIRHGIKDAEAGDTILISDLDEIPRPECVTAAAKRGGVTVFRQLMFCYFLNYLHLREDGTPGEAYGGTVAYRHDSRADLPQRYSELRHLRGGKGDRLSNRLRATVRSVRRFGELEGRARLIDDAGWHFSYLGGIESIIGKLEAYSHVEYNTGGFKSRDAILTAIEEKRDLFGRAGRYELVPVDRRFPTWLQENAASRYPHLLAPER